MALSRLVPDGTIEPCVAAVVAGRFGGDEALYREFAAVCAEQFALDVVVGRAACAAGDLPALRRLAHDLKSALNLLGRDSASCLAASMETQAASGDLDSASRSWRALDDALCPSGTP